MPFTAKYTQEQKQACVSAALDKGVRPYALIAKLAAEGALTPEPFQIDPIYIGRLAREEHKKRLGLNATKLHTLPVADANEALRRRLVALAEHHLERLERKDKQNKLQAKDLSDMGRVLREVYALPGPDQPRPVKPGAKIPGEGRNNGGPTRGGLAGAMLQDIAATPQPTAAPHTPVEDKAEGTTTTPTPTDTPAATQPLADSWARERVAALLAEGQGEGSSGPG